MTDLTELMDVRCWIDAGGCMHRCDGCLMPYYLWAPYYLWQGQAGTIKMRGRPRPKQIILNRVGGPLLFARPYPYYYKGLGVGGCLDGCPIDWLSIISSEAITQDNYSR